MGRMQSSWELTPGPVTLFRKSMAATIDGTPSGTVSGTFGGSDFLGGNNVNNTSATPDVGGPTSATEVPVNVTETPIVSESEAEAPVVESNVTDVTDADDVEEPAPVVENPPALPPKNTTDAMGSETDSAMAGSGGAMN